MQHHNNVRAMLNAAAGRYDPKELIELMEEDSEAFVDDVAFLLTTLLFRFSPLERRRVVAEILNELEDETVAQMRFDL